MENLTINIGGNLLDTDEQTNVGFGYQSEWLVGDDGSSGKRYSFDLSVPDTTANRTAFQDYEHPAGVGIKRAMSATVGGFGVMIDGTLFVSGWSGGRYSLLFVSGAFGRSFRDCPRWIFPDVFMPRKTPVTEGGRIPNFGQYSYNNTAYQSGAAQNTPTLYPVANLGYIIDTMAAYAGFSVVYPDPLQGRCFQADAYGIILPTLSVYNSVDIDVSGSAAAGWSVTPQTGTLADAGLTIVTRRYKRGLFNSNKTAHTFEAVRPVRVTFSPSQNIVVASGQGYDIKNDWSGSAGCSFDMAAGDWFTIVDNGDWTTMFGNPKWNGEAMNPRGYETSCAATFTVEENAGVASGLSNITLADNLPDLGLADWLAIYCDTINAFWRINGTDIEIIQRDILLHNLLPTFDFDERKLYSLNSVKRYIEGWAQKNDVRYRDADYIPEPLRYLRRYEVDNDYLDEQREILTIPANAGEININQNGHKEAFFEDIIQWPNGEIEYRGTLGIIYENLNAGETDALHVQAAADEGVGQTYGAFTRYASTFTVSVNMDLMEFFTLTEATAVAFGGGSFVIRSAQWAGGIASIDMLSVSGAIDFR